MSCKCKQDHVYYKKSNGCIVHVYDELGNKCGGEMIVSWTHGIKHLNPDHPDPKDLYYVCQDCGHRKLKKEM